MASTRRIKRYCPNPAACAAVDAAISRLPVPISRHAQLMSRVAVTFKACHRRYEDVPAGALDFDAFRMFVASRRLCEGRGDFAARIPLAIYKPTVDLPGTGRIDFALEAACDLSLRVGAAGARSVSATTNYTGAKIGLLATQAAEDASDVDMLAAPEMPRFYWAFHSGKSPVFEPAYTTQQWAESETRIGLMRAWPAEMFIRDGRAYDAHPVDGTPAPEDATAADGTWWGMWLMRDGRWVPKCQEPDAIYAYLAPFRGRAMRNPAWDVMRAHGVIATHAPYREWRETRDEAAFAAALTAYCEADPGNSDRLVADVVAAFVAVDAPVDDMDYVEHMIAQPWLPVTDPRAAAIQVVRLTGAPAPATMEFQGPVTARLYDIGGAYEQVEPRRLEEASRQRRRRSRSWHGDMQRHSG